MLLLEAITWMKPQQRLMSKATNHLDAKYELQETLQRAVSKVPQAQPSLLPQNTIAV